eukprot:2593031-Amphidinium_carterae.1
MTAPPVYAAPTIAAPPVMAAPPVYAAPRPVMQAPAMSYVQPAPVMTVPSMVMTAPTTPHTHKETKPVTVTKPAAVAPKKKGSVLVSSPTKDGLGLHGCRASDHAPVLKRCIREFIAGIWLWIAANDGYAGPAQNDMCVLPVHSAHGRIYLGRSMAQLE